MEKKKEEPKRVEPEHLKTPWFDRDEHKAIRTCTCFCGHVFQSQARLIEYIDKVPTIDKHGLTARDKHGQEILETRITNGVLSYIPCPKCKTGRIKSYAE